MPRKTVRVQLMCSLIGMCEDHHVAIRDLGLRRTNSVSELQDTPAVRDMVSKVSRLVKVIG